MLEPASILWLRFTEGTGLGPWARAHPPYGLLIFVALVIVAAVVVYKVAWSVLKSLATSRSRCKLLIVAVALLGAWMLIGLLRPLDPADRAVVDAVSTAIAVR